MLGLRLAPRLFVIWLAATTLILMSASMMAAQTPVATVEKAAVEASAAVPESASKNAAAPITNTKEEIPAAATKTETEPVKANTATPSTAPAAPQVVTPCPQGSRVIKADVVAIPQAIMLNRLGATIPNGFVFALRSDTVTTGLGNLQLRPGKDRKSVV